MDADHLHAINISMFGVTWASFFGVAAISFAIQMRPTGLWQSGISGLPRFCFPPRMFEETSSWIDVIMYAASKFTAMYTGLAGAACHWAAILLVRNALTHLFPGHVHGEAGYAAIAAISIGMFLAVDFANYLSHYLQHFVPVLWELHKVHHSATHLNPLTTKRMHPLGDAFDGWAGGMFSGLFGGVVAFHFDFTASEILILVANSNTIGTIAVLDAIRHSHFRVSYGRFDKLVLSPHMHQLHHSCRIEHWDKNFGNKLSVWDWLFATAYVPGKTEEIVYGLGTAENHDYGTVMGVYAGPLQKIARLIARHIRPDGTRRLRLSGEGWLWRAPGGDPMARPGKTGVEGRGPVFGPRLDRAGG